MVIFNFQFSIFNLRTVERLDLNGRRSGKMKTFCPLCREQRKNKRDRSVSVDLDKGVAYCHYCGTTFCKNKGGARNASP
jgi:ribosomal protein S27E